MEAALAIATLVLVLVLCLAGVTAVSMQVRCIDAAREAARLAARGDVRSATDVARSIAPRATLVARAMRVEHAQCRVVDLDVVVTVEVAVAFAGVATATARAGPAKVPTTPG